MHYLQRFTDWSNGTQPVTDAEIISFDIIKTLLQQSQTFSEWWSRLSSQQKHDALDNIIRTTNCNLDILIKHDANVQ